MCKTRSGITLRGGRVVVGDAEDSHEALIASIRARDAGRDELARWEVTPIGILTDFRPEAWRFAFDENAEPPTWWEPEHEAAAVREALASLRRAFNAKTGEWSGNLDLHGTAVKSLGRLTSVGGYLNLYGTAVKSLGRLTSVGGYLNLHGTAVKSLGRLTSVGGYLDLYGTAVKDWSKVRVWGTAYGG